MLSPPSVGIPNAVWEPFATIPRDRRILVLCTSEAPFPVMIGRWNGEAFVSRDEGVDGKKWSIEGWLPLPEPGPVKPTTYRCTFCGKDSDDVRKLIAGPTANICCECVEMCGDILLADASAMEARQGGDVEQAPSA